MPRFSLTLLVFLLSFDLQVLQNKERPSLNFELLSNELGERLCLHIIQVFLSIFVLFSLISEWHNLQYLLYPSLYFADLSYSLIDLLTEHL